MYRLMLCMEYGLHSSERVLLYAKLLLAELHCWLTQYLLKMCYCFSYGRTYIVFLRLRFS